MATPSGMSKGNRAPSSPTRTLSPPSDPKVDSEHASTTAGPSPAVLTPVELWTMAAGVTEGRISPPSGS